MNQILKTLNEGLDRKYIKENKDYDDELTLSSDDLFMGDYDDYLEDEDYSYDDWDDNELSYPAKYPSRMNDFIIDDVDECLHLREGARGQAIGTAIGGYFGHPALGGKAGSALEDKALEYARKKLDKFKLDNGIRDDEEAYRELVKRGEKKAAEVGTRIGKKIGNKIMTAGSKLPKVKKGNPTVATESISNNATKSDFIRAYKWIYGATDAEARKAFINFDEEAKQNIIKAFKQNAKKSFLSDGLHRSNSKSRRLKESLPHFIINDDYTVIQYDENGKKIPIKDKKLVRDIINNSNGELLTGVNYQGIFTRDIYESYRRRLKEARNSSRKRVTQKYLKDLIKSGKAENLNTWTDSQLNELQKKNYETIAVSFGINGMNGILLQDDDGKLYAVPSRSTTMFQMHKL